MNSQVNEILSFLLSDKSTSEKLSELLSKQAVTDSQPEQSEKGPIRLNEKQLMLQRKIDILTSFKALLGEEYSKKADTVINALNTAIVILGFKK